MNISGLFIVYLMTIFLALFIGFVGCLLMTKNDNENCIHPATLMGCEITAKTVEESLQQTEYELYLCYEKLDKVKSNLKLIMREK